MNTQQPEAEIKTCPFCGKEMESFGHGEYKHPDNKCILAFMMFEGGVGFTTEDWNRRAPTVHEERYKDPKSVEIIGTLEKELADNEQWMREVLTDFRIPFDDHKIGRRLAFTQWMFERQSSNNQDGRLKKLQEDLSTTDTFIRNEAKRVLPELFVDGDSNAVPMLEQIVEELVKRLIDLYAKEDA